MAEMTEQRLLQQGLTIHDLAAAKAYADGEVERVKPLNRAAYRAVVLRRVYADLLDALVTSSAEQQDVRTYFETDLDRRRLLAKLEAEAGFHVSQSAPA